MGIIRRSEGPHIILIFFQQHNHIDMKNFTKSALLTLAGMSAVLPLSAAPVLKGKPAFEAFRYRTKSTDAFKPDLTFGPASSTGDMDAPGAQRWFYTAELDYEVIPADHDAGIYYDKKILRHYTFHFFDENCQPLGSVDSDMAYEQDEDKVAAIEIAPVASRHFFNTNDAVEVMVSLSVNTVMPGTNHYRTLVYSLKSPEEASTESIMTIGSILGDVVEGEPAEGNKDNFYMVFGEDVDPVEIIEDEDASFWDYVTAAAIDLTFYGPAKNDTDGPVLLGTKNMPLLQLPGDQESSPYLLSYVHDGKATYMFSYLEEPIWERYDDPIYDELVQRENNKLHVEFYEAGAEALELVHQCTIDVVIDVDDPDSIASFYGVGDMNYDADLLYDAPGAKPNAPWMVVTRSNYNPSSDKSSNSYFLYDQDGKKVHDLALYCDSSVELMDIPGYEPQQMFVHKDAGFYMFRFVDLYSAKEQWSTMNYYDLPGGDYEAIMANVDRTPYGDSYRYAFELSSPGIGPDGEFYVRVLWVDEKGKYVRLDNINAGQDVLYASVYIDGPALQPNVFYDDDASEYLYLVKRGQEGSVLREELYVSQPVSEECPEGRNLLSLGPDEHGILNTIIPIIDVEDPELVVYYYDSEGLGTYTQDVYKLPLGGRTAVDMIQDALPGVTVEGSVIKGEGTMKVYTLNGVLAAEGDGALDLSALAKGIYVIVNGADTLKIQVK